LEILEGSAEQESESIVVIPSSVARWVVDARETTGFFANLTLMVLHLKKTFLSKNQIAAFGETLGVSMKRYASWLNKTFMSPHGPMKGLVLWKVENNSKARLYSLSPLGTESAEDLMMEVQNTSSNNKAS